MAKAKMIKDGGAAVVKCIVCGKDVHLIVYDDDNHRWAVGKECGHVAQDIPKVNGKLRPTNLPYPA